MSRFLLLHFATLTRTCEKVGGLGSGQRWFRYGQMFPGSLCETVAAAVASNQLRLARNVVIPPKRSNETVLDTCERDSSCCMHAMNG